MLVNPLGNNVAKAAETARILIKPDLVAFAEYVWARSKCKNKGFVLRLFIVKHKE